MLEIVKILASLLGGGLAGAVLSDWFRRKRERVQRIQLIERVNRPVSPLEGFTVARIVGSGTNPRLEEVRNLREYQLTMRNSTSTHLQNAEVQFEFPADDVQALVSLPTLSRTPLVLMDALRTAPGRKAFRWTIPQLPSDDSVEFTFRAVAPSSESYEAALYYRGVIFEKVVGEPPPKKKRNVVAASIVGVIGSSLVLTLAFLLVTGRVVMQSSGEKLSAVKLAGCDLQVVSLFDVYGQRLNSPWQIKNRIFNVGSQDCVIQSKQLNVEDAVTVKPGDILERERVSEGPPKLVEVEISIGATGTSRTMTTIPLYLDR